MKKHELPVELPEAVRMNAERYISSLRELDEENLVSIVLYGSAARGEYVDGVSNINLLVVLRDDHIGQVKRMAEVSRQARKRHKIEPRFLSLEMIKTASDVLPIAFLDMQRCYWLLLGEDVLKDIMIEKHNLRYQCEYQLRFDFLRMRHVYLFTIHDSEMMADRLVRSFTHFLHLLKYIYLLHGEDFPLKHEDVIMGAKPRFGLNDDLMRRILDLKLNHKRVRRQEVETLFEGYLDLLQDSIRLVDDLEGS